jgi:hypothetical protein
MVKVRIPIGAVQQKMAIDSFNANDDDIRLLENTMLFTNSINSSPQSKLR